MSGSRLFCSSMGSGLVQAIPYVPAAVALEDLSPDGCLLSDEQIKLLYQLEGHLPGQRRYSKQEITALIKSRLGLEMDWPYSLIYHENVFYVIYKGVKQGKHLGLGAHGKVKLAQSLDDNSFYALKLQTKSEATNQESEEATNQKFEEATNQEFEMLRRVKETPQNGALAYRVTKSGKTQSMILMKLARGLGIDAITDKEIDTAIDDENNNQIITGLMSPALRIQLALDALKKLDTLHLTHCVIHRDLQPGNIMLDLVTQQARLIDFGQAIAAEKVTELQRSGSDHSLKGSTRNYSPKLRRRLSVIMQAHSEGSQELPEVIYDRSDEMYAIGISLASFFHLLGSIPEDLEDKPEQWGSHIIEDDLAEFCFENYKVLPTESYRKVLALVRRMTENKERNRISFEAAIAELSAILAELNEIISVGLLDVSSIDDVAHMADVIQSAQKLRVDEVLLADCSGRRKAVGELLTIQRQLQEAGLRVGRACFINKRLSTIEDLAKRYLAHRPVPSELKWIAVDKTLMPTAAAAASP